MAIGLGSWGAEALGLKVLGSGPSHRRPHHRLDVAPRLWKGHRDRLSTD